jgi:DNA-binding transcriptional MerR regulator
MLKIGELSKLTGLSVKTLRFYSECGLLSPAFVDELSGYRYFDDANLKTLELIKILKRNHFSLNEIKEFINNPSSDKLNKKHKLLKLEIESLNSNIRSLHMIENLINKGDVSMNKIYEKLKDDLAIFENDEALVGKWKSFGLVKNKEDFLKNKYDATEKILLKELYILPNGKGYWIVKGWSKWFIKIGNHQDERINHYEIIEFDNKTYLLLTLNGLNNDTNPLLQVFEKLDSNEYSKSDIATQKTLNYIFEDDPSLTGIWEVVDFVKDIKHFSPNHQSWKDELFLSKAIFMKNGEMLTINSKGEPYPINSWTKNHFTVLFEGTSVLADYYIKQIELKNYLFLEWISGDVVYGKRKPCYYVLIKQ